MLKQGYAEARAAAKDARPWEKRDPTPLWRGSYTGIGLAYNDTMSIEDKQLIQRVRLCLSAKSVDGVDIKFAVGSSWPADLVKAYAKAGVDGGYVRVKEWLNRKFAIDIDS